MSLHESDDILKVAKILADKVIKHSKKCRHMEYPTPEARCLELDQLADIARQITPDLSDA